MYCALFNTHAAPFHISPALQQWLLVQTPEQQSVPAEHPCPLP
jgi:hypothetical protein